MWSRRRQRVCANTHLVHSAVLAFCVLLLPALGKRPAYAQPDAGQQDLPGATESDPADEAGLLPIRLDLGDSQLDPDALLQAIALELGVDVTTDRRVSALAMLTVKLSSTTVTMTFTNREEREVSRAMELPSDPDRQVEVIALLAGNLARDQAGELLERMRKTEPKVVKAEPVEAPSEPPPPAPRPKPPARPKPPSPRPPSEPRASEPAAAEQLPLRPVNLSLWHPVALYPDSEQYAFGLELGLGHGRVGALRGFGGNLLLLSVDRAVTGAAVSTLITRTGGNVEGVQLAGLGNLSLGRVRGVDGAGLFNLRAGEVRGGQIAGVFNISHGGLVGVQASGVFNRAGARVQGSQLAGAFNWAGGDLTGVQAGISNFAHDVDGAQIGVVNVGRRVDGLQLGVVNVADEVDGLPLGLVNVISRGRTSGVAWYDNSGASHLGVKYLNGGIYTLLAVGFAPNPSRMAGSLAIGGEIPVDPLFIDLDAMYTLTTQFRPDYDDDANYGRLRAILGWQIAPAVAVFAGGGPQVVEEQAGEFQFGGHLLAGAQLF